MERTRWMTKGRFFWQLPFRGALEIFAMGEDKREDDVKDEGQGGGSVGGGWGGEYKV